jgi:hypothetical protein
MGGEDGIFGLGGHLLMGTCGKSIFVTALTGLAFLGSCRPAAAQFYGAGTPYGRVYSTGYGIPGGYYNPYGYGNNYVIGGDPYGGYLSGAANVINAQGQYLMSTQQAYLTKEAVRSAQIDNRRKAFDEWMYEKANTPTLNETRMKEQRDELQRALTQPPETEIWSGYSLNNLLANAQQMQARGLQGPDVPLNSQMLKNINVSVKQQGNAGLLKQPEKLKWPLALQTLPPKSSTKELRDQIDTLMVTGKSQTMTSGQADADVLEQLDRSISKLRGMLRDQVSNISFGDYTAARRYLSDLDQAVTVLKQADAGKYVSGAYAARGRTVNELVDYMSQNGLKFAPAVAGGEGAYSGLYQAFLRYTLGSGSMSTTPNPLTSGGSQ